MYIVCIYVYIYVYIMYDKCPLSLSLRVCVYYNLSRVRGPEAAHRQKLDDALHYLQLLPNDATRLLTPSAASQAKLLKPGSKWMKGIDGIDFSFEFPDWSNEAAKFFFDSDDEGI